MQQPYVTPFVGGASAATVRSSKSKFAIYTCIVRTCESTLQAEAIGGWLQSGRSRVRALLWNSVFFLSLSFSFFFPLLFPLSSFSPLPSLYLSPFLFPLHARSATSMLKHFSSIGRFHLGRQCCIVAKFCS